MTLTATQLFANYTPSGPNRCFYCCGQCDETYRSRDVVKSTFTALDTVSLSDWVCRGCVEAMAEGIDLELIDGTRKTNQKTRGYSWIITKVCRKACTKAHRQHLLNACLHPPDSPFVICISDSGQKHLLYLAKVNSTQGIVTVSLEGEPITYRPQELQGRMNLCKQVCAATGKPAMKGEMSPQTLMRISDHFASDDVLAAWLDCFHEPLTRLAVWLCPNKEDCIREYPKHT